MKMKEIRRARQQGQESLRTTGAKTCSAERSMRELQRIMRHESKAMNVT
jgi:hypothetical protein